MDCQRLAPKAEQECAKPLFRTATYARQFEKISLRLSFYFEIATNAMARKCLGELAGKNATTLARRMVAIVGKSVFFWRQTYWHMHGVGQCQQHLPHQGIKAGSALAHDPLQGPG